MNVEFYGKELTEEDIYYILEDRKLLMNELTDEVIKTARLNKKIKRYEEIISVLLAAVFVVLVGMWIF